MKKILISGGIVIAIGIAALIYVMAGNKNGNLPGYNNQQNYVTSNENIKVFSPKPNDEVGVPLRVVGEARVFENVVSLRLKDQDGTVLAETFTNAEAPDMGQFGVFDTEINYKEPKSNTGILEVFENSAKDGSEINKVSFPIRFKAGVETTNVQVYFSKQGVNDDCSKVFAVTRRVPSTPAIGRAALTELLAGPRADEAREGYITNINTGVRLIDLKIENGKATAEFGSEIEQGVGGSCRVTAIRAQITQTLKQFSTVKEVVISVDGRTEDVLQP